MNNPYDIYNDNRAYQGYKRGVAEALDELVKRYDDCHNEYPCPEDCPHLDDDITCARCIANQIKEEVNEK